ncbi:hypothetical protein MRX96_005005 [Rhipicephalus microplus]
MATTGGGASRHTRFRGLFSVSNTPASTPSAAEHELLDINMVFWREGGGTADTTGGQGRAAVDSEDKMRFTSVTLKHSHDDSGELGKASSTNRQKPPAKTPQGCWLSLNPKPKSPYR